MSIHNIGFYEDLTKNIFELSSNIIKYAPYFFCCMLRKVAKDANNENWSYHHICWSAFALQVKIFSETEPISS